LLSTSHVGLSRCVGALLRQGNEVKQHIEATISPAAETVLHRARTGRLDRSHASQHSDLRHTEARSRHAEFGDQPGSNDRLYAGDLQQREELLTNAGLDVGAELALLIHEQPNLLGNLAHCVFPNPIQLASSGSAVLAS
jgi:hypothetical protein